MSAAKPSEEYVGVMWLLLFEYLRYINWEVFADYYEEGHYHETPGHGLDVFFGLLDSFKAKN